MPGSSLQVFTDGKVGDLAGKHGNLTGPTANVNYTDQEISLDETNAGFIGGRAVVIHRNDLSRFVCAKYFP